MKKTIFITASLMMWSAGHAQFIDLEGQSKPIKPNKTIKVNPKPPSCADLVVERKELEGEVAYKLPEKMQNNNVLITRTFIKGFDFKKIRFMCESPIDRYGSKGLYFKLSNGEIIQMESVSIKSGYLTGGTYLLQASIDVTPELYTKLSEYDITQFSLAGQYLDLRYKYPEDFRTLFRCMFKDDTTTPDLLKER